MRRALWGVWLVCAFCVASPGLAATFCVTNGAELQTALSAAASNGEDDVIRLQQGLYTRATGTVSFTYSSSQNRSLTLDGGWLPVGPAQCVVRTDNVGSVRLDGEGQRAVLQIITTGGGNADITLRNLSILNGNGQNNSNDVAGALLSSTGASGAGGDVAVERVVFRGHTGSNLSGALSVSSEGGVVRIINNLFDDNACGQGACAASLLANNQPQFAPQPRMVFLGNTVVRSQCLSGSCSALRMGGGFGGTVLFQIDNSVFALNEGADIDFALTTGTLRSSRWDSLSGTPQTITGNLPPGTAPGFQNAAAGDFRLTANSPLIDAGIVSALLPALDLASQPRSAGAAPDIGAYEWQPVRIFADGFEN